MRALETQCVSGGFSTATGGQRKGVERKQRLLRGQFLEPRFYRTLASDLAPDNGTAQIALRGNDPVSAGYVDRAVRFWKTSGALAHAREQRAGDIAFEVGQLQDGMVCHN